MGRIHDALRRGRPSDAVTSSRTAQTDRVFVSPWSIGDVPPNLKPDLKPDLNLRREREPELRKDAPIPREEAVVPPPRPIGASVVVNRFGPEWTSRLSIGAHTDQSLSEQFRRFAATLMQAQREGSLKRLLITSAVPGEGKTLTAVNLALILSESYRRRVLLIDADLRRPSITEALSLKNSEGLSEAIQAIDDMKAPLAQLTDTLTVLPAGRRLSNPLSSLTSLKMARLLEEAGDRFDWVIIDTPPLGAAVDASLICPMVDAALLVVRAAHTAHPAIQRAVDTLGQDRILGVVLNGVEAGSLADYDSYGYGYAYTGDRRGSE
jgi:protein-tyrosine kinase